MNHVSTMAFNKPASDQIRSLILWVSKLDLIWSDSGFFYASRSNSNILTLSMNMTS